MPKWQPNMAKQILPKNQARMLRILQNINPLPICSRQLHGFAICWNLIANLKLNAFSQINVSNFQRIWSFTLAENKQTNKNKYHTLSSYQKSFQVLVFQVISLGLQGSEPENETMSQLESHGILFFLGLKVCRSWKSLAQIERILTEPAWMNLCHVL